jgi:hypothetical protein
VLLQDTDVPDGSQPRRPRLKRVLFAFGCDLLHWTLTFFVCRKLVANCRLFLQHDISCSACAVATRPDSSCWLQWAHKDISCVTMETSTEVVGSVLRFHCRQSVVFACIHVTVPLILLFNPSKFHDSAKIGWINPPNSICLPFLVPYTTTLRWEVRKTAPLVARNTCFLPEQFKFKFKISNPRGTWSIIRS